MTEKVSGTLCPCLGSSCLDHKGLRTSIFLNQMSLKISGPDIGTIHQLIFPVSGTHCSALYNDSLGSCIHFYLCHLFHDFRLCALVGDVSILLPFERFYHRHYKPISSLPRHVLFSCASSCYRKSPFFYRPNRKLSQS